MEIPITHSKRLTHTYIDDRPYRCELTDVDGITTVVSEYCYIHMEPSTFSMKLSDNFIEYLIGIEDEETFSARGVRPELQIIKLQREEKPKRKRSKPRKAKEDYYEYKQVLLQ